MPPFGVGSDFSRGPSTLVGTRTAKDDLLGLTPVPSSWYPPFAPLRLGAGLRVGTSSVYGHSDVTSILGLRLVIEVGCRKETQVSTDNSIGLGLTLRVYHGIFARKGVYSFVSKYYYCDRRYPSY